jgi:putative transcriptional regulator
MRSIEIPMQRPVYLSGQYLLAMPGIGDPRFSRAVIALCAHDDRGALGVGVGHVVPEITLHDLLRQLDIEPGQAPDVPVHHGGPVEPQRGFVLHSQDWGGDDSVLVGERWTLTSTLDVLRAIAEGRGPSRFVVSLGYAGWGEGQLDEEMTRHGWFATPGDDALLFDVDAASRWKRGFADAGIDVRLLASTSGNA